MADNRHAAVTPSLQLGLFVNEMLLLRTYSYIGLEQDLGLALALQLEKVSKKKKYEAIPPA